MFPAIRRWLHSLRTLVRLYNNRWKVAAVGERCRVQCLPVAICANEQMLACDGCTSYCHSNCIGTPCLVVLSVHSAVGIVSLPRSSFESTDALNTEITTRPLTHTPREMNVCLYARLLNGCYFNFSIHVMGRTTANSVGHPLRQQAQIRLVDTANGAEGG